ncbi:MAG: carbamate kinase [Burkholderiales bacterium PBB4]|nr:MAG: carbamate kinase [Burkholderiales bacterium PBB4]
MKIVVALGGNALLQRHQPLTAAHQLANIRIAAAQLARVAANHELVLTHGNGPQVGLLALQGSAYSEVNTAVQTYPLDVLGAQTEGMIGYLLEQELANLLGPQRAVATLLTRVEVSLQDPAFALPTKPIGPMYSACQAEDLARAHGWTMASDGKGQRRVVASPKPLRILSLFAIETLLAQQVVVIAAGGGGIPVAEWPATNASTSLLGDHLPRHVGVEAVIDKDWCAALLARELGADCLVIATDVAAVFLDWGTPGQQALGVVTPQLLSQHSFASGSMAPKVAAACEFVTRTGRTCHIGALGDIEAMLRGTAGTTVSNNVPAM